MNVFRKDRPCVKKIFLIATLVASFSFGLCTLPFDIRTNELATVVGKPFSYKLPVEMTNHQGYTFKFKTPNSDQLPAWLTFDGDKNILLGVPSQHDKGSQVVRLDIIEDATNRTVDKINYLTIEVVEFEEDLNHFKLIRSNALIMEGNKNSSTSDVDCPSHSPVIVATLVFDLNSRELTGAQRIELLYDVSKWIDMEIDNLRWMPGKGEKTAFNLKDVVLLTAGPGVEKDPKKRGVSVSWKIGCGDRITENEKSFASVGHLKSASQNSVFSKQLNAPVVAWHVTYGRMQHRHAVRMRRQAVAQTPLPTSTITLPTSTFVVISTPVLTTPSMTISPTLDTVAPVGPRTIPTPSQTAAPFPTPTQTTAPFPTPRSTVEPPPINTPPYLANAIDPLIAKIDEPFSYDIPPNTFLDKEDGQTPNLRLNMYDPAGDPLPVNLWVQLMPGTNKLQGIPRALGDTRIALIVTDKGNLKSQLLQVIIRVVDENEPPYLYNPIDLIPLYVGQPIVYPVPFDTFHDKEDGDTTKLRLSMRTKDDESISKDDTTSWVEFDDKNQIIYALPPGDIIGKHEFLLIAYDGDDKKAIEALEFHVNPLPVKPNHFFNLELSDNYKRFDDSVTTRVKTLVIVGNYFEQLFNSSYNEMRVSIGVEWIRWHFANIARNITAAREYERKYVKPGTENVPYEEFKNYFDSSCRDCAVTKAWLEFPQDSDADDDPDVRGRKIEEDEGTWWEYTIIPAFVVAAVIFIVGLIIIVCIRCRRKSELDKNEKVVFVQRKKPAVFREEYPLKEAYGEQTLVAPNEKAPLPPPGYPRSSTPTEDQNMPLPNDNSPTYQAPFEMSNETAGSSRPPAASYRLPPPYVAP